MKKLFVLLLALTVVFAFSATAFAEGYTIEANSGDTHSYAVYQIFTGDYSEDTESAATAHSNHAETLANIKWGAQSSTAKRGSAAVDAPVDTATLDAIKAITGTDAAKAAALAAYADLEAAPYGTIAAGSSLTDVPAGYYLIKDTATLGDDDSHNLYVVQVLGNTKIEKKRDVPSVDKEIVGSTTDTDFAGVGDTVSFKVTGTLPSDYADDFTSYYFEFSDTMTDLTYVADSAEIKVGSDVVTGDFTIAYDSANKKLTAKCNDLKTATNKAKYGDNVKIVLTYDATVDSTAAAPGKAVNTAKIVYTNDPNTNSHGNTTPDETTVFNIKLIVNKVDESDKALDGAEFTLYKWNATTSAYEATGTKGTTSASGNNNAQGNATTADVHTWTGLDTGKYKLVETKTPTGYNTMADKEFEIVGTSKEDTGVAKIVSLNSTGDLVITGNTATGTLTSNIQNQKGSELPETGGMGTTILYILGGALVVIAGVLLVTRRRMQGQEK